MRIGIARAAVARRKINNAEQVRGDTDWFTIDLCCYLGGLHWRARGWFRDFLWMLIKWLDLSASRAPTIINASEREVVDNFGTERIVDLSWGLYWFEWDRKFVIKLNFKRRRKERSLWLDRTQNQGHTLEIQAYLGLIDRRFNWAISKLCIEIKKICRLISEIPTVFKFSKFVLQMVK